MKSEKNSLDLRNKIAADITNFSDTEEAETWSKLNGEGIIKKQKQRFQPELVMVVGMCT